MQSEEKGKAAADVKVHTFPYWRNPSVSKSSKYAAVKSSCIFKYDVFIKCFINGTRIVGRPPQPKLFSAFKLCSCDLLVQTLQCQR